MHPLWRKLACKSLKLCNKEVQRYQTCPRLKVEWKYLAHPVPSTWNASQLFASCLAFVVLRRRSADSKCHRSFLHLFPQSNSILSKHPPQNKKHYGARRREERETKRGKRDQERKERPREERETKRGKRNQERKEKPREDMEVAEKSQMHVASQLGEAYVAAQSSSFDLQREEKL